MSEKARLAVFPGTFDPPTLGHFDIIERAQRLFDEVLIAVAASPSKHTLFSLKERTQMLTECCRDLDRVRVTSFTGLLVDFLKAQQAQVLVRGVRRAVLYLLDLSARGLNSRRQN